jgi:site-specific recombinase XerD
MSLNQLIDQFELFLSVQKHRSKHTISNYSSDIKQFFALTSHPDITTVNDDVIGQYLGCLNQLKLSTHSIYRKLVSLDQFWSYLVKQNMCTANPWSAIKRPKVTSLLPVFIEEETVIELLNNYPSNTAEDIRNKAILELLFASGIRVSELIQLNVQDIDMDQYECRVLGKGNKYRIALFGDRAHYAISTYLQDVRQEWAQSAPVSELFISKRQTKLTARTIQRILKHANQFHSSSIEITPHSCRHTCASLLIANGAGIRDVQEFLGHSSITTTERYTHIPTKTLTNRFLNAMKD